MLLPVALVIVPVRLIDPDAPVSPTKATVTEVVYPDDPLTGAPNALSATVGVVVLVPATMVKAEAALFADGERFVPPVSLIGFRLVTPNTFKAMSCIS